MSMRAIRFIDVTKRFGDETVFNGFSLTLSLDGPPICLTGRSGSGKTTLFHLILGLIRPDCGRIEGLDGERIVAVFQENRLLPWLNAVDNCLLVTMGKGEDRERVARLLGETGLDGELVAKPVGTLSGGQQRRVAIVRALVAPSTVILMDEPLKGMDVETVSIVTRVILDELQDRALIFSTHDPEDRVRFGAVGVEIGK